MLHEEISYNLMIELQGGPSGRGQPLVDIAIRVALPYKKFILWQIF